MGAFFKFWAKTMSSKKIFYSNQLVPKFEDQCSSSFFKNFKIEPELLSLRKKLGEGKNLIIFLGSSGAGRDTILENCLALIKDSERIKRTTTRFFRIDLEEKERMNFIAKNKFLSEFKKRNIILAGYYRANNNLYGISHKELSKLKDNKRTFFYECTITALPLKKLFPEAKLILILPPSLEELKDRLSKRGDKDWKIRFEVAASEIKAVADIKGKTNNEIIDFVFINGNPKKIARDIVHIIKQKRSIKK